MDISIQNIYKRYTHSWVLKDLSQEINSGQHLAIKGANGSGKSTLLHIISGILPYTQGSITYSHSGATIDKDDIFQYLSIAAAYTSMDNELTAIETFEHVSIFKKFKISLNEFIDLADFKTDKNKRLSALSSGTYQRLKLSLALAIDTPLLLLDEPTSFLDQKRKDWFVDQLKNFATGRTTIIASNDETDLVTCTDAIIVDL